MHLLSFMAQVARLHLVFSNHYSCCTMATNNPPRSTGRMRTPFVLRRDDNEGGDDNRYFFCCMPKSLCAIRLLSLTTLVVAFAQRFCFCHCCSPPKKKVRKSCQDDTAQTVEEVNKKR